MNLKHVIMVYPNSSAPPMFWMFYCIILKRKIKQILRITHSFFVHVFLLNLSLGGSFVCVVTQIMYYKDSGEIVAGTQIWCHDPFKYVDFLRWHSQVFTADHPWYQTPKACTLAMVGQGNKQHSPVYMSPLRLLNTSWKAGYIKQGRVRGPLRAGVRAATGAAVSVCGTGGLPGPPGLKHLVDPHLSHDWCQTP